MSLLTVEGLTKTFVVRRDIFGRPLATVRAVRNVSFTVGLGETVALVGESGSGKSTTGRLVLRLIEADAGEIIFDGVNIRKLSSADLREMRKKMQVIFQDPLGSFDPNVTIGHSIAEPLLVHFNMARNQRLDRAAELLAQVGMDEQYLTRSPRDLSGGQLQRAAIARALTLEPKLIVCDECVAALDVSIRAQVLNLMMGLQGRLGISYLFITHDLSLVRAIADSMNVMSAGEIVESGAVVDVFSQPSHDYTKRLLEAIPKLTPDAELLAAETMPGLKGSRS